MFRLRIYEVKTEYVDYLSQNHDHLYYDKLEKIRENILV